jgi:hypothetical protein
MFDQDFQYELDGNRTLASLDGGNAQYSKNQVMKTDFQKKERVTDSIGLSVSVPTNLSTISLFLNAPNCDDPHKNREIRR